MWLPQLNAQNNTCPCLFYIFVAYSKWNEFIETVSELRLFVADENKGITAYQRLRHVIQNHWVAGVETEY